MTYPVLLLGTPIIKIQITKCSYPKCSEYYITPKSIFPNSNLTNIQKHFYLSGRLVTFLCVQDLVLKKKLKPIEKLVIIPTLVMSKLIKRPSSLESASTKKSYFIGFYKGCLPTSGSIHLSNKAIFVFG